MIRKLLKSRVSFTAIILVFVIIILMSILQIHNNLIDDAEKNLDEQIEIFAVNITDKINSFESEMTYNSSIGNFSGVLDEDLISNEIKERIRRVYSMNSNIIDMMIFYNENSMRSIYIEESNYFSVSDIYINSDFPIVSIKKYAEIQGDMYYIMPVYKSDGTLDLNVAIKINMQRFLTEESRDYYLGEEAWIWVYEDYMGFRMLSSSGLSISNNLFFSKSEYIIDRLNNGYRGRVNHSITVDKERSVLSSFYPVTIGERDYGLGFSISRGLISGQINLNIFIIIVSFIFMMIIISFLFRELLFVERNVTAKLENSNKTLDNIIKEMPVSIVIHDHNFKIISINDIAKDIFGLSKNRVILELNLIDYIEDIRIKNDPNRKYMLNGKEKYSIIKNTVPIEYFGNSVYLTAIIDVTDIENARKLAEDSNQLKSDFIANISHEIRTPMNGIIASVDILKDTQMNDEQNEFLDIIDKSANNLMIIINDILDLSKIESGKLIIENIQFNLREAIESVYDQFIIKSNDKKIDLISDVKTNIPNRLIGDPNRLKQILTNLIGNAVKFTEKGFIYISADLIDEREDRVLIKFVVADTGIGIPPEKIENIFEPFTQADGTISRRYGGTGLGTTICKKIVTAMGGTIKVISPNNLFEKENPGTVFEFILEFALDKSVVEYEEDNKYLNGLKGLIIEDNEINVTVLERMLKGWGVKSMVTDSKDGVIKIIESGEFDFDFILVDMVLKDCYGDELIKDIKSIVKLPENIIIISSSNDFNKIAYMKSLGAEVLMKPVKHNNLYSILRNGHAQSIQKHEVIEDIVKEGVDYIREISVLVVEDNPINMKIFLKYISKICMRVDTAENGQEAVEKVKKGSYDIVFMDLQMPILNGLDATKKIRLFNKDLIIIAITANAMESHKSTSEEAGMNDFISKPVKYEDIKTIMDKYIPQKG